MIVEDFQVGPLLAQVDANVGSGNGQVRSALNNKTEDKDTKSILFDALKSVQLF